MAALPTHETLPADHKAAIRQMKQALRAQIGDVQAVFDKLSARISERLDEINALKATGQEVWPTIPFSDIAEGKVSDEQRAAIKRRGCAVIRTLPARTGAGLGQRDAGIPRSEPFR